MKTTPTWLRGLQTFGSWPQMPDAHMPFGADHLTDAQRTERRGIPLFINVQTPNAVKEAHALGGRALTYISFYDTYVHTAGFENGTARVPWEPARAPMLLLDAEGRFVNTPMDGSTRMWRYLVCNNTREYVEAALGMVRAHMENGADGLFIDNSGKRAPCYGHGLPVGYTERYRGVCTAAPKWEDPEMVRRTAPEALYRQRMKARISRGDSMLRELPVHRHIYPGQDHAYAYCRLLEKVRKLVRSYGSDKVIVANGHAAAEFADGVMTESYIYSWAWQGRRLDWPACKKIAADWQPYLDNGGKVLALSYFGKRTAVHLGATDITPELEEAACYAFTAALLSGFAWSDYETGLGRVCDALRRLDLGQRLTGILSAGNVDYSFFNGGLLAINGSARRAVVRIPSPRRFRGRVLVDIRDQSRNAPEAGGYRVALPAHTARVLLVDEPGKEA